MMASPASSYILVTGGAGYIGSHTVFELLLAGHKLVVVDNLSNSSKESLLRIERHFNTTIPFYQISLLDHQGLDHIFQTYPITAVIHLAGVKSITESFQNPGKYYLHNIVASMMLLQSMAKAGVTKIVFSSSATVYGEVNGTGIVSERDPLNPTNVYGETKLMVEQLLQSLCLNNSMWKVVILRYFNPIGAHPSGLIGEDPNDVPQNLVPYISQVLIGKRKTLKLYGNNYDTPDRTGVRDFIHVVDVALGHLSALKFLNHTSGCHTYNLGTGSGYSVLQVIQAFEEVSKVSVKYKVVPERPGDVARIIADPSAALKDLGWSATKSLFEMCRDTWNWQQLNPNGYLTESRT